MKNNDDGFSTPLAVTVIFSLSIIALSFSMITATTEKRIDVFKRSIDERKKIDSIIYAIEKEIQPLKHKPSDSDVYEITSLIRSVFDHDFTVTDVSTGINKNFTSDNILKNKSVRGYIEVYGEKAFTEYGWINPKFADSSFIKDITQDFKNKNTFPLVNSMSRLNIFFMNDDFIKTVLEFYGIKNAKEKTDNLRKTINADSTIKEIADALSIEPNHPLFDLIGLKTIFWKVDFETDKSKVYAVFAAVPERENHKKIEKYILVKKDIISKGGDL